MYKAPELVVALKSPTNQYLAEWDVGVIESTASDLLSSANMFTKQLFYTDIDFLYAQRVVYKTITNQIAYTQAVGGLVTFYQVGAALSSGSILS